MEKSKIRVHVCDGNKLKRNLSAFMPEWDLILTNERMKLGMKDYSNWEELCKCNSDNCVRDSFIKIIQSEKDCRVFSQHYQLNFQQSGKNKWISPKKMLGICDILAVRTIKYDEKAADWKYIEDRDTVDSERNYCKYIKQKAKVIFEANSISFRAKCESINFGPGAP